MRYTLRLFRCFLMLLVLNILPQAAWAAQVDCKTEAGADCPYTYDPSTTTYTYDCSDNCYVCEIDSWTKAIFNGNVIIRKPSSEIEDCKWRSSSTITVTGNVNTSEPTTIHWSSDSISIGGNVQLEGDNSSWYTWNISVLGDVSITGSYTQLINLKGTLNGNLIIIGDHNKIDFTNVKITNNLEVSGRRVSVGPGASGVGNLSVQGNVVLNAVCDDALLDTWSISRINVSVTGSLLIHGGSVVFNGQNIWYINEQFVVDGNSFVQTHSTDSITVNGEGGINAVEVSAANFSIAGTLRVAQDKNLYVGKSGIFQASSGSTLDAISGEVWNGILVDNGGSLHLTGASIKSISSSASAIKLIPNTDPLVPSFGVYVKDTTFDSGAIGVHVIGDGIEPDSSTSYIRHTYNGGEMGVVVESCIFQNITRPVVVEELKTNNESSLAWETTFIRIIGNTINGYVPYAFDLRNIFASGSIEITNNTFTSSASILESFAIFLDNVRYGDASAYKLVVKENIINGARSGIRLENLGPYSGPGTPKIGVEIVQNEITVHDSALALGNSVNKISIRKNTLVHPEGTITFSPLVNLNASFSGGLVFAGNASYSNCFSEPNELLYHIGGSQAVIPGMVVCTHNSFHGHPRVQPILGFECNDLNCFMTGLCQFGCNIENACYYTDEENPDNSCQYCDPQTSLNGWTAKQDGTECPEGECCGGICMNECECVGCRIGGVCYNENDVNPTNACEICLPSLDNDGWSLKNNGTDCPGGFCYNGSCCLDCYISGQCYPAGSASATNDCQVCDPSVTQTDWTYSSDDTLCSQGICISGICRNMCHIDSEYYTNHTTNPDEQKRCQECNTAKSFFAWSAKPNNTPCPNLLYCDGEETCQEGECRDNADPCRPSSNPCEVVSCSEDGISHGTPCQVTILDDSEPCLPSFHCSGAGYCKLGQCKCCQGCMIDHQCYQAHDEPIGDRCMECDPARNAFAWSVKLDGASCADPSFCNGEETCLKGICEPGTYPCLPSGECIKYECIEFGEGIGACGEKWEGNGTPCNEQDKCRDSFCFMGSCHIPEEWKCEDRECHETLCVPQIGCMWHSLSSVPCNDGIACNGSDTCIAGECGIHQYTNGIPDDCPHCNYDLNDQCEKRICREVGSVQPIYECDCSVSDANGEECDYSGTTSNCGGGKGVCSEGKCRQSMVMCDLWMILENDDIIDLTPEDIRQCNEEVKCKEGADLHGDEMCYYDPMDWGTPCSPKNANPCLVYVCKQERCHNPNSVYHTNLCGTCREQDSPPGSYKDEGEECGFGKICDGRGLCIDKPTEKRSMGSTGGTFALDSGAQIVIPAGALTSDVEIGFGEIGIAPDYLHAIGPVFRFGPAGTIFNVPVEVTMTFDEALVSGHTVTAYWTVPGDEEKWQAIPGERVGQGLWKVRVEHFSLGVVGLDVNPCPVGCKIYEICYNQGEVNRDNTCEICDREKNPSGWSVKENASSCEDGNHCTLNDACLDGQCVSGILKDCKVGISTDYVPEPGTILYHACFDFSQATCDTSTGQCSYTLKEDGQPCMDYDACTEATCQFGRCVPGPRRECPPTECASYSCDARTGQCEMVSRTANGTVCEADNDCAGSTCQEGQCISVPRNEGKECKVNDQKGECDNGSCIIDEGGCQGCNGDAMKMIRIADAGDGRSQNRSMYVDVLENGLSLVLLAMLAWVLRTFRYRGLRNKD